MFVNKSQLDQSEMPRISITSVVKSAELKSDSWNGTAFPWVSDGSFQICLHDRDLQLLQSLARDELNKTHCQFIGQLLVIVNVYNGMYLPFDHKSVNHLRKKSGIKIYKIKKIFFLLIYFLFCRDGSKMNMTANNV